MSLKKYIIKTLAWPQSRDIEILLAASYICTLKDLRKAGYWGLFYKQHLEALALTEMLWQSFCLHPFFASTACCSLHNLISFSHPFLIPVLGARVGGDRQDLESTQKHLGALMRYGLGTAPETAPPPETQLGCSTGLVPAEEVSWDIYLYSMGFTALIQEPLSS